MMLVDSSVWVDHLRIGDPELITALNAGQVATHPFVVGELACGTLRNRGQILELLGGLPTLEMVTPAEAFVFLEGAQIAGRGIGYVDVHLLASARLAGVPLWTRDRRLRAVAAELGLADSRH